ncbi:MAG TPA: Ig-like domain-containing protein, partial [Pyrinomonadaceae bacterium]|nr:Ig-like domain-containing protein [Pyrinomonadaceae bacterium]
MPDTRPSARRTTGITWPILLTVLIVLLIFPGASSSRHTFRLGPFAPNTHGEMLPKAPIQTRQATIRTGLNFKTALAPAALASLAPIADAYVSSTATSSNFGTLTELRSKLSTLESYLKFDLASLGTESVISAKLRLTGGLNDTSGTNVVTQVFSVASTTWTETGILWSNKPTSGSTALATVTVTDNVSGLYEWDVTAFVKAEINAERNLVSLVLKNPSTSTPYATFNSREAASNPPELVITTTAPPTVSITSPAVAAYFLAPATITIDADASDADGITKVEFLQGSTVLATDTTFPYSFTWANVAVGNYSLTARATDTLGATKTSTPVDISVLATLPPTVVITSPARGSSFPAPATITIDADASDSDGILKVDFYQGSTLLGTDNSFPYSFTWTGMPACTYFLTARATDSLNATA